MGVVGIIGIRLDIDFTDQTTAALETAPPLSALWLIADVASPSPRALRASPRQLGATAETETASCTLELVALQYTLLERALGTVHYKHKQTCDDV
jgi:hypothetical protein